MNSTGVMIRWVAPRGLREGVARWYRPTSLAIALHILIPLFAHGVRPLRAARTDAPGHLPGDERPIDLLLAEPAPRAAAAEAPAAPPGAPSLALLRPGRASGVALGATLIFESDASNLATNKKRRLRSRVRLIPGV
ncbi:hypothetical protein WME91_30680 [Sorangium sp. So ce269]